jgi:hypothetical protein
VFVVVVIVGIVAAADAAAAVIFIIVIVFVLILYLEGDDFLENLFRLGPKDVNFSSNMSVNSDFALCGFLASKSCVMMGSRGSSREDEEGDKEDLEPVPSFFKVHSVCKTVKSFLYVHNKHGEQNTLNLQLALFCLKRKASI